ncbi:MAG: hypothetical protein E6L02_07685 [Thaumarchaeota archaeon]|nr:MAG: hypothetical protein E6L02_07685 [Nitrososphaerota archaeon]
MCNNDILLNAEDTQHSVKFIWDLLTETIGKMMPVLEPPTLKFGQAYKRPHASGVYNPLSHEIVVRAGKDTRGYYSLLALIHELTHARGFLRHGKVMEYRFPHILCNDKWSVKILEDLVSKGIVEVET